MGLFERYLSIWVFLAIVCGLAFGFLFPNFFLFIAGLQYARVNFVTSFFIWVMIYPMMLRIDFSGIKNFVKEPKGLIVTLVVNWLIKPFTMFLIAILFFKYIFVNLVTPSDANSYIAGMILLGVAPCTAMVFVWSMLVKGNSNYTFTQVAVNDVVMLFLFAPIANFLLRTTGIDAPWDTILLSILLFVFLPMFLAVVTRNILKTEQKVQNFAGKISVLSIISLLLLIVVLFALQSEKVFSAPLIIVLIAIPLLLQSYLIFFVGYFLAFLWKLPFNVSAPAALIGTSNFFELAIAVAISIFGLNSGAALATVVGVLVEVPVMLSLVAFCNRTRRFFAS